MSYPGQPRPLTPEEAAYQARTLKPEELNPCLALPQLRAALAELMTGSKRSHIQFGNRSSTYHPGDVKSLRAEIRKLEILCDPANAHGRAVRAGPVAPNGMFPLRPHRTW